MAKSNVPAKTGPTALALPEDDFFGEYAGAGMENVGAADMLVPRLAILQALSPQLKPRDAAYIEGAQVGDIADLATGDLFKGGVMFLPVYYRKDYLEWAPRNSGRGLVQIHNDPSILDSCQRDEKNRPVLTNGNLVVETAQFFGFNLATADRRKCFIPMSSTQLKKARKWITLAQSEKLRRSDGSEYVPPLFFRGYELGVAEESNAEGSWMGWVVNRGPALPEMDLGIDWQSIGKESIAFRDMLFKGQLQANVSHMQEDSNAQEVM